MRLTCTNCDARYEVPDDAVPAAGRDVQCSNCGHTWFVKPKPLGFASRSDDPAPVAEPAQPRRPSREIADAPNQDYREVLRQEAIRELEARKADADPDLEIQPDLGIKTPATVAPNMQSIRAAAAPVSDPDPVDVAQPKLSASRDQLPDIEEINSSLSAATKDQVRLAQKRPEQPVDPKARRKRGFRFGFVLALLILAAFVALYVFAPQLAEQFPSLADELGNYVLQVNDLRQTTFKWVEDLMASVRAAGETPTTQN